MVRNRVKRLIREAFRAMRSLFGDSADIVVIVRSPSDTWNLAQVVSEWNWARERIVRTIERLSLARQA